MKNLIVDQNAMKRQSSPISSHIQIRTNSILARPIQNIEQRSYKTILTISLLSWKRKLLFPVKTEFPSSRCKPQTTSPCCLCKSEAKASHYLSISIIASVASYFDRKTRAAALKILRAGHSFHLFQSLFQVSINALPGQFAFGLLIQAAGVSKCHYLLLQHQQKTA